MKSTSGGGAGYSDQRNRPSSALVTPGGSASATKPVSRYEAQNRRDLIMCQKPPLIPNRCNSSDVEGGSHTAGCPNFGLRIPRAPCECGRKQLSGSLVEQNGLRNPSHEKNLMRPAASNQSLVEPRRTSGSSDARAMRMDRLKSMREYAAEKRKRKRLEPVEDISAQLKLKERKLNSVDNELNLKKQSLDSVSNLIEERKSELNLMEELGSVKKSVENIEDKLQIKKEQMSFVQNELNLKKQTLSSVTSLIEDHKQKLMTKQEELVTVTITFDGLQNLLWECCKELELREMDLDSNRKLLNSCEDDINMKTKKIELLLDLTSKEVMKELKSGKFKLENLRKQFDCKVISIVLSSLRLIDLEEHYEKVQMGLEDRAGLLQEKVESAGRAVEEKESEIELCEKELSCLETAIAAKKKEIVSEDKWLWVRKKEVVMEEERLGVKKKEADLEGKRIHECSHHLNLTNMALTSVTRNLLECSNQLIVQEERLNSLKKLVTECEERLRGKQDELNCVNETLISKHKEVTLTKDLLAKQESEVKTKEQQVKLEEDHLNSLKKLVADWEEKSRERTNVIETLISEHKFFDLTMNLLAEHSDEVRTKEQQVEVVSDILGGFADEVFEKKKEVDELESLLMERSRELELREMELDAKQSLIKVCGDDIDLKMKKLKLLHELTTKCQRQLDLKQKEVAFSGKSTHEVLKGSSVE